MNGGIFFLKNRQVYLQVLQIRVRERKKGKLVKRGPFIFVSFYCRGFNWECQRVITFFRTFQTNPTRPVLRISTGTGGRIWDDEDRGGGVTLEVSDHLLRVHYRPSTVGEAFLRFQKTYLLLGGRGGVVPGP